MALSRDKHRLIITIDNIGPADAIALKKMFEYMQYLGNIGSSRRCSFYADGDGSFHPKVSFDYPIELPEVPEVTGIAVATSTGGPIGIRSEFSIDSDDIAWYVYHDPEPEDFVREKNPQKEALQIKKEERMEDEKIRAWDNGGCGTGLGGDQYD
jgi:hypothetical protein